MHFNLNHQTVFLTVSGSHAYGMATATSDVDLRGVCVTPLNLRLSYLHKFDQFQGELPEGNIREAAQKRFPGSKLEDTTIYDLAKAVKLIADNNPNMMEMLWVRDQDILFSTPTWEAFRSIREHFLSQRCKYTFLGYAHAQYKKIESHRKWLLDPPKSKPTRSEFGLEDSEELPATLLHEVNQEIKRIISSWQVEDLLHGADLDVLRDRMTDFWSTTLQCDRTETSSALYDQALASMSLPAQVNTRLRAEKEFRASLARWNSYCRWRDERNPARAELEEKFGFDTKHASHLLRLSRMAVEILRDKQLHVFRPDAEELLAVRRGQKTFDEVKEEFTSLETMIEGLSKTTLLPRSPNHEIIDQTLVSLLREN